MRPRVAVRRKGTRIKTAIANNQAAVVIHCAGGKERTGIIIALLLAIANVPEVTIAEDYAFADNARHT